VGDDPVRPDPGRVAEQAGVVLAVLGVIELVVTGVALAVPSTRHKNYDL